MIFIQFSLKECHFASQEVVPHIQCPEPPQNCFMPAVIHFVPVDVIDIDTRQDKDPRLIIFRQPLWWQHPC